ncbi:MAG: preprotein translocase subunit YajC [Bacteroidetes bacterium]|nr:preprotein translocase subunit YajC [Bacteroidota bacterium]
MLSILLQATSGQGGGIMQIVFLVSIIVVFYLFMIRPQVKKQKAEKTFRETLTKGAKVVTIGGIHGRIVEVNDKTFMVEIDTNVKVRVEKICCICRCDKSFGTTSSCKIKRSTGQVCAFGSKFFLYT